MVAAEPRLTRLSFKLPPLPPLDLKMSPYGLPRGSFSRKPPADSFAELCSSLASDNARVAKQITAGFG